MVAVWALGGGWAPDTPAQRGLAPRPRKPLCGSQSQAEGTGSGARSAPLQTKFKKS